MLNKKTKFVILSFTSLLLIIVLAVVILRAITQQPPDARKNLSGLLPYLDRGERIIDGTLEGESAYIIISTEGRRGYGNLLTVYQKDEEKWSRDYENDFEALKPWKLELADIDQDGQKEILIAVKKTTHYDKEEKNRLFVFNYKEYKLVKKWTGSQIAGDWINFISGDLLSVPGDELMFIEKVSEQKQRIIIYYWFDFGFVKLAESDFYEGIRSISVTGNNRIKMKYGHFWINETELMVKNGKIVEASPKE